MPHLACVDFRGQYWWRTSQVKMVVLAGWVSFGFETETGD
jgi:hypothetical protein